MKKKLMALFLALSMAVSLVTPAIATGDSEAEPQEGTVTEQPAEGVVPEEEVSLADTTRELFTTLLGLYEEKSFEDAGLILAALSLNEDGQLPENPELPEGYTLPALTQEDRDAVLEDILTEDQLDALQALLDEEAEQAKEEPPVEEPPAEEPPAEEPPAEEPPAEEPSTEEPTEEEPAEEPPVEEEPVQEEVALLSLVKKTEKLVAAELTLQETFDLLADRHAAAVEQDYAPVVDVLTALTVQEAPPAVEPPVEEPPAEEPEIEEAPSAECAVCGEPLNDGVCALCDAENMVGYTGVLKAGVTVYASANENALFKWTLVNDHNVTIVDQFVENGALWYEYEVELAGIFDPALNGFPYVKAEDVVFEIDGEEEAVVIEATVNGVEIAVEGSLSADVALSAAEYSVTDPSEFGLADASGIKAAYDIKILDADENEIQPEEAVFLTMDAETMGLSDGDVVEVIHQHGSDIETTKHVVINGNLVFPASGFSVFIVNSTSETTGTEIMGNSQSDPYEMTVGETKIFFDSYGGGSSSYQSVDSTVSTMYHNSTRNWNPTTYYYLDADGTYREVKIERTKTGESNWNPTYSYTVTYADGSGDIPGMVGLGENNKPSGFYTRSTGSTSYRGEWQVTDTTNAIDYEITSVNYQNNQHMAPYIEVTAKDAGDVTLTYKYVQNSTIYTETFYIRVVEPVGTFYVDDQVAESGCLVPVGLTGEGITYTWSRSDGQAVRAEALNKDGRINVSIDRGGVTNDRDPITYTVVATMADGTTQSASYEVVYGMEILNPSFETPEIKDAEMMRYYNGYPGLYWKTTAPGTSGSQLTQDIELIVEGASGFGIAKAAHGKQFAEVNAENYGALYQDMLTTPGAELKWSFSHAGRITPKNSINTVYVVIGPTEYAQNIIDTNTITQLLAAAKQAGQIPTAGESAEKGLEFTYGGATYQIWQHTNGTNVWQQIAGEYTVPNGQYLTRLFFASDPGGSGDDKTCGNFIDAASAGQTMSYKIEYYPNDLLASDKTETGDATVYTTVSAKNLGAYLTAEAGYVITGVKINGKDYAGDITDGVYITDYGTGDKYAIEVEIYLKQKAITVTKVVDIAGWDSLTDDEKAALIPNDGYVATFGLFKGANQVSEASVNIAYSATGALTAVCEFSKAMDGTTLEIEENVPYTVKELSASPMQHKVATATYQYGTGEASKEPVTVTLKRDALTANVTVTNSYVDKMVTINYEVAGNLGGSVTLGSESLAVMAQAAGSTATPSENYHFVGWYSDAACTTLVSQYAAFEPVTPADGWPATTTFYAKFVEDTVTINYKMVGPDGVVSENLSETYGQITSGSETLAVLTGTATGSAATAASPVYKFVGWYSDAECTNQVTTTAQYTPIKSEDAAWTSATYYAKFEYNLTSLTIKKTAPEASDNERFIFNVSGPGITGTMQIVLKAGESKTISGLTVGKTYTVTEKTDWSWRYDCDGAKATVDKDAAFNEQNHSISVDLTSAGETVTFTNNKSNSKWLSAVTKVINTWTNSGISQDPDPTSGTTN